MKKLWLVVLFVLVPISMTISSVIAEQRLRFVVPQHIKDKYLINIDPDKNLYALPAIRVQDCRITMYIVAFMTKEHCDLYNPKDRSNMKEEWVMAEGICCGCSNHTPTNRLLCFRVRIDGKWKVVYTKEHPEVKKKKELPLPKHMA